MSKSGKLKFLTNVLMWVYQNLFFIAITKFTEKKVGTKWYKIFTTQISIFRITPGDPCAFIYFHAKQSIFLMQHLFELKIYY